MQANASERATRDYEQIAREILEEADAVDARRTSSFGDARGDELPPELATGAGPARVAARGQAPARCSGAPRRPGRSRARGRQRLREAKRRLEEELETSSGARTPAYEAYRARGVMKDGRRFGAHAAEALHAAGAAAGQGQPHRPRLAQRQDAARLGAGLQRPGGQQRAPDRDRRRGHAPQRTSGSSSRWSTPPTRELRAARRHRRARGGARRRRLLAPATDAERSPRAGIAVLIPPDANKRKGARPGWDGGLYAFMRTRPCHRPPAASSTPNANAMIEPVFAHTKFNRRIDRFQRRGRAAAARNGDSSPPPTTSSSSGGTPRHRSPPEARLRHPINGHAPADNTDVPAGTPRRPGHLRNSLHGNLQSQRPRDWPPRPCERGTNGGTELRVRRVNAQALRRSQPGRGLVSDLG